MPKKINTAIGHNSLSPIRFSGYALLVYMAIALYFPVHAQEAVTDPARDFNATLEQLKGEVLIFKENKYVPASNKMRVGNGDRLMVMRNSEITIVFDSGCTENVKVPSIHKVDEPNAKCLVPRVEDHVAGQPVPVPPPTTDPAVITAIIAIPLIFDDDDEEPVSP